MQACIKSFYHTFVSIFLVLILLSWQQIHAQSPTQPEGKTSTQANPKKDKPQKEEKKKPSQLYVLKLNVTSPFVNEVRVLYEHEIAYSASLEFGAGYIYKRDRLFDLLGELMLAGGFQVQAAYRKYSRQDRYIFPPAWRSYFSPVLWYSNTRYDERWFLLKAPDPNDSECFQETKVFNQFGIRIQAGFQTRAGRFVLDGYTGLGLKWVGTSATIHAINRNSEVCEIMDDTEILNNPAVTERNFAGSINLGINVGYRMNDRERPPEYYKKKGKPAIEDEDFKPF